MEWGDLDWEAVARRLRALQQAVAVLANEPLGVDHDQMGEWAGVSGKAWGMYVNANRGIPPLAAAALKVRWGVAMDWIYTGDAAKNDPVIAKELDRAMRHPIPPRKGRKPLGSPKGG
jgi:hypothetical protein